MSEPQTITELTDLGPTISIVVKSVCVYADNGWFRFQGSQERIFLGLDCEFKVGDPIDIVFRPERK